MKTTTSKSSSSGRTIAQNACALKPLALSIAAWVQRPGTWSVMMGAVPALAFAQMPAGGTVVGGSATIDTPDANHTVIQQSSDKAIINWQSFSIGNEGYVQFVQPGVGSVALNRVVGADPSSILGHLSSNGQVFLVNPNGVFFGANAVVDVAGIVATTLNIRDEDFMRGDYRFLRDPNAPEGATVINEGSIGANGGYVVLAGDYAANNGVIQAQLGTALLASGDALTLQMAGSTLVNYAVDKATVAHLAGVSNTGQILANGGRVIMTADVANDLAATVVNNSGLIQAQSAVEKDGAIYFEGQGGNVANSGTLDASAQAGADGGHVDIRASGDIIHEAGSKITVSGADTGESDAGSVYTWADGTNRYKAGAVIEARGGAEGGDGGMVELSGNAVVNRSIVDLRAPEGEMGTLLIDPSAITIANGAGLNAEDGTTVYEQNVESQLRYGNVILDAAGENASITLADLADDTLDGTDGANGGSLTLTASGSGNPTIVFADTNDSIKVSGSLTLTVDDGAGSNAIGSMNIGNLQAGKTISLKAGSISTGDLVINKTINTSTDTSYSIAAQAYSGDLTVNGDVLIDVTNTAAAAVAADVNLNASGNLNVTGAIASKATGKGYYHYNWATAGNAAPTYYSGQPWTLQNEGDHRITANLDIHAGGNITATTVDVLATDNNTEFATQGVGGYWQTATTTQHNFWRPTATQATAAIDAGGDITLAGKATVKADGYATSDYSETESWRQMVDNFNYASATQTVRTDYGCLGESDGVCTGGYGFRSSYTHTQNDMKGSATGNYIWEFGDYTYNLPASSDYSPTAYKTTDWNAGSHTTAMRYTGANGLTSTLDINAGGSVTLNGLDVRATNRSTTGTSGYTDINWGRQDSADNLNGTADNFTSATREIDYYDNFRTRFTAATSTARVNITAGDNQSVTLHGGEASYDVVASHPGISPTGNHLASAGMTITAGTAEGASGLGQVILGGPIRVEGADDASVNLVVRNHDGVIMQTDGTTIAVTNHYSAHDASARFTSLGDITLDSVAVAGGRSASLDASTEGSLQMSGASSATTTGSGSIGSASINLSGATGVAVNDLSASATQHTETLTGYNSQGWWTYTVDGSTAAIDIQSATGDVTLQGNVSASGYETATVTATASGAGATLTTAAGKSIGASATGAAFGSNYTTPAYTANVALTAAAGLTVNSSVAATAGNGSASVALTSTGGSTAGIVQAAGSVVKAEGRTGAVTVNAGNAAPDVATAAAISLAGDLQARGTTGTATLQVTGKSGLINNFSAVSTGNAASATISALDGSLTVGADSSTGTVTGNADSGTGASLSINSTGALDSRNASFTVANNSTGSSAGAQATFNASNGSNQMGAASVSGYKTATLSATGAADLLLTKALSATANATAATARIALASTDGALITSAPTGAISATANGSSGTADVDLSGASGMTINGNVTATATNNGHAMVDLLTTGGRTAGITQGSDSTVLANGTSASLSVKAGSSTPDATNAAALALAGTVQAAADTGAANLDIIGKSGSVHNVGATSTGNAASVRISSLGDGSAASGALTLAGTGTVAGNNNSSTGATLTVSTTNGVLDTSAATLTVTNNNTGTSADALATLTANDGTATLGSITATTHGTTAAALAQVNASAAAGLTSSGTVSATANGVDATALVALSSSAGTLAVNNVGATGAGASDVNLTGATGLAVNGNVTALGGTASVDLLTTGGANASITQDGNSTIQASGTVATTTIVAGDATPDATNGAALSLDGTTRADASGGTADVNVAGGTVTMNNFSATSTNGTASATVNAYGANLTVNGNGTVAGNAEHVTGARLTLTSAGSLDTSAATLATSNNSTGQLAGAAATLSANGGSALIGQSSVSTQGAGAAQLSASGRDGLSTAGNMAVTGNGNSDINLSSSNGNIVLDHALEATGATGAAVSVTGHGTMAINADITAAAGTGAGATIDLVTNGGNTAAITQGSTSTIRAGGSNAAVTIKAGAETVDSDNAARIALAGALEAQGSGGTADVNVAGGTVTMNNFSATSTNGTASANVNAYGANLTVNGNGMVTGNADSSNGADLALTSAGDLDTRTATLTASNDSTGESAGARATFVAGGIGQLGAVSVEGYRIASLAALGAARITTAGSLSASATATAGAAQIGLQSSAGTVAIDADSGLNASADGSADIDLVAATGMAIDGDVIAAAGGGAATVDLVTTAGSNAAITQGSASTISAQGVNAAVTINSGSATPDSSSAAAFNLGGTLQATAGAGTATVNVAGKSGSVNDFSAISTGNTAGVTVTIYGGSLAAAGNGTVSGNADSSAGAELTLTSAGDLDTRNANLSVTNDSTGASAAAKASLAANGGNAQLGRITVTGKGGGESVLLASAANAMTSTADMRVAALGLGAHAGSALASLSTTGSNAATSSITQNANTTISAISSGNAGNARVDIQAGDCCNSTVTLNGEVEAVVHGGSGDATVAVRGDRVSVAGVKANVDMMGTGNALVDLAAPTALAVNGTLDVQAADADKRADIKLISDQLTYRGGNAVLSAGNGHVQLASFDTTRVIGVDSDRDFDAEIQTNYALATLQKFVGNQAEIVFGGEYDRSAWMTGTPAAACVPGMANWVSKVQQTADIHVAGNGKLDLGDVKMVFDTTGTTYYHHKKMSPWSVPEGRLAVFVARPNVDRYLDRTDNTLQTMTEMIESHREASAGAGTSRAPTPGSTHLQGKLFMAGNGVNIGSRPAAAGGAGANTGTGTGISAGADAGTDMGTNMETAVDTTIDTNSGNSAAAKPSNAARQETTQQGGSEDGEGRDDREDGKGRKDRERGGRSTL